MKTNYFLTTFFALVVLLTGCTNDESPDPVNSQNITVVTDLPVVTGSFVSFGGSFTNPSDLAVFSTGVVISENPNPIVEDPENLVLDIPRNGNSFSDTYSGFEVVAGMTLYVRAYVEAEDTTFYGPQQMFVAPGTAGCPVVEVTSGITSPTVWTAGTVYVISSEVTVTSVLTIEPGTIIKFNGGGFRVNTGGTVNAIGTGNERIIFTSIKDDTYCGDTNMDGTATSPAKGDWGYVYLNGGNNTFKHCDFLYAGSGSYNAVYVSVSGAQFEFDNCTFAHTLSNTSHSSAFAFHGGSYMSDPSVSKFTNNAFYDNDRPIYLNIYYNLNPNNIFHNPANPNQKNTRNGIWTWLNATQGATVDFMVSEVPYVIEGFFNGGGSGATGTVNIGAGAVLKFLGTNAGISRSAGRTVNLDASAVLTSFKDDAHGGDTNGDGSASMPANNDWDGYYEYQSFQYLTGSNIFYDSH